MRRFSVFALLCLPSIASAVPLELLHQGRLYDFAGVPIDGSHTLTVAIYDQTAGGTALWSESISAGFDQGYFAVRLETGLDAALFAPDDLYVGLAIDGGLELPQRQKLASVPFAVRADHALNADLATAVDGGVVNATEIQVNGTTIIDSGGAITAAPQAHVHDAVDVASGILDINRLPVGIGATNVAAGDHGHTAIDVGALPLAGGTLTGTVNGTDAAFSGAVGGGTGSFSGAVDAASATLSGELTLGSSGGACSAGSEGAVRYDTGQTLYCDGTNWLAMSTRSRLDWNLGAWRMGDGTYGATCEDYRTSADYGGEGYGRYWLDPDGDGANPVALVCDMDSSGAWQVWEGRGGPWYEPNDPEDCWQHDYITKGDVEQMKLFSINEWKIVTDGALWFSEDDSSNLGTLHAVEPGNGFAKLTWTFQGFGTNHMRLNFDTDPSMLKATCNPTHSCGTAPNWPAPDGLTPRVIITRIDAQGHSSCGATASSNLWFRNRTQLNGSHYNVYAR